MTWLRFGPIPILRVVKEYQVVDICGQTHWLLYLIRFPHAQAIFKLKGYLRSSREERRTFLSFKFLARIFVFLQTVREPVAARCSSSLTILFPLTQALSGFRREDPEVEYGSEVLSLWSSDRDSSRMPVSRRF